MAGDNEKTITLMFLKEQALRWAAKKNHKHVWEDIEDDEKYAPIRHDSTKTTYGVGSTSKYGHVKVDTGVTGSSTNPVQSQGINTAINNAISGLRTELNNKLQDKVHFVTEHLEEWKNDTVQYGNGPIQYAIPTAKAVYDTISNYKDLFKGRSLDMPKDVSISIDNLIDAGYYHETGNFYFQYGNELIYYYNGLIKVEVQLNRIIQHVYSTSDVNGTYKINGSEYTRWGVVTDISAKTVDWKPWHVAHKPYTKTARATNIQGGADSGSIVVYENTAGFIIHWDQTNAQQNRYPVTAQLYEYETICEFAPPLPIKGPYVFGNLIGRFDVKITSDKMQIRSNVSPGGRIIEMHETFFVPRNQ